MTSWEFPATEPIDLYVKLASGSVSISAKPTEIITVDVVPATDGRDAPADVRVEFANGRLEAVEEPTTGLRRHHGGTDLAITIPVGSRCTVRTASARVSCAGELGSLDAETASGEIGADVVTGPVKLNSASGRLRLGDAGDDVTAHSASGQIWLQQAGGDISATTASGDLRVGTAAASVTVQSASGKIRIDSLARGDASLTSVSGTIEVGVAAGTNVYLDLSSLSGRVSSDLDPADQRDGDASLRLHCRSVSGAVRVARARSGDAGAA
jgi:DUF4097 and DUF4098 domain-containing protein YvlB